MDAPKLQHIKLSSLLKGQFINLDLKGDSKIEVIRELVKLIAKSKKLKNNKAFFNAVIERENMGSTGIGNGVAIPHAKSKGVQRFVLAFARKNEGIDFQALDGEKTHLFFILASPQEDVGKHLKVLAAISHLVKDKFIIESLKRADNKKEILKIISGYEKNLSY